ncbi:hypothetical protein ACRCJU_01895 [Aerococcus urinaeequi]|uniref:hypothetical protein n=1 Tax=Aerococcus urinaeequi TaxID=51665 RepID=UPI003D6C0A2F
MEQIVEQLMPKLKSLLGSDSKPTDIQLDFALEATIETVLTYCHIDVLDWPIGLNNTAVLMTIDALNENARNIAMADGEGIGDVKAITEGDFRIEHQSKTDFYKAMTSIAPTMTRNYAMKLNNYRKLG